MKFSDLQDIVENAGFETRSYSGRAMYGSQCLSFSLDRDENEFDAFLAIAEESQRYVEDSDEEEIELEDVVDYFKGAKSDSMGLGMVIYFPRIEWEGDEEDIEEDEDNQ